MSDLVELRNVLKIVVRRWWVLILVAGLVTAAGYVMSQRQTPTYEGAVTLLVGPLLQGTQVDRNDILVSEMLAQTYANLARRQPVLQGAIDNLGLSGSWTGLRSRVSVDLIEETQLLQVRVQARSPDEARIIAEELGRQLILLSPTALASREQDENQQFVRQRLESLRSKIDIGQARLEELEAKEATMVGSSPTEELRALQEEINTLEILIAGWENSYSQFLTYIKSEQSTNFLAVVEPAHASSRPVGPRPLVYTAIAGMIGLGLALALVFVLEFLDDTLRSAEEVSEELELTSLGTIGHIKSAAVRPKGLYLRSVILPWGGWLDRVRIGTSGEQDSGKLINGHDPSLSVAEAFRMVRSNIRFVTADQPPGSILITSPGSGEGKSIVAANLAIVMAQAGHKTILVDANLRHPVQHELFKVSNSAGLVDLIRSPKRDVTGLLKKAKVENLEVLTSGKLPPDPSELLGSLRMNGRLEELCKLADIVILDSPPVSASTDAAVLANQVDGVVLVIGAGRTRKEAALQSVKSLRLAKDNLIGAVLNKKRRTGGWLAAAVLPAALLVGLSMVWLSGRGTVAASLPPETLTAPAALAAAWTATVIALPTSTASPTLEPSAIPTLKPSATPTLKPSATPMLKPSAAPTLEPTATLTPRPSATPTHTPSPTPTDTPSPAPSATPSPTALPPPSATPAGTAILLPPPRLLTPLDRQDFQTSAEIVLTWEPAAELAPDAHYAVTVAYLHLGERWLDDVPWTRDTSWTLTQHAYLLDLSDDGQFWWSVQVVRLIGTDASGNPVGVPISEQSEERAVTWRKPASGEGFSTPAPPPP